jgi:hypothetical protein
MCEPIQLKNLILLELNEINFDVVSQYIVQSPGKFCSLDKLMSGASIITTAEDKYEELEPWIQWPSVHTGLSYSEHGIFRLGDVVSSNAPQIFEELEKQNLLVGSISAMNAENRLKNSAYFIPDPWTKTPSGGEFWIQALSLAISQAANDNSQSKVSFKTFVTLLLAVIRFAKLRHYTTYLKLALSTSKSRWRKALFLDLLLHDIHLGLRALRTPDFSTLFLNAGAHIQHHYFFSSKHVKKGTHLRNPDWYISEDQDPFEDMLEVYEIIIGDYLSLRDSDLIIATGLSQKPNDKVEFYYRLKNHSTFLDYIGIEYRSVIPRMARDFLIQFDSSEQALAAQQKLNQILIVEDGVKLFGEIDNRGQSLFVVLTYPNELHTKTSISVNGSIIFIKPFLTFVAIKNGMHQAEGYAFFTAGIADYSPSNRQHVKEIHGSILNYFNVPRQRHFS